MKQIIKFLLTPEMKAYIKCLIHFVLRFIKNEKLVDSSFNWSKISSKNEHVFFGYYDISPFNDIGDILYVKKRNDENFVNIMINNSQGSGERFLSQSYAWNWQQGCRLRWLPKSNDKIIFNIFEEGTYKARMINTQGEHIKDLPFALYDIDNEGIFALSLDFGRLGVLRPGYGYTCKPYNAENLYTESIKIISLLDGNVVDKITYKDIINVLPFEVVIDNCYINHLSFSPDSNRFLFFWIEILKGYHKASLLVYDMIKKIILPIETKEKVSHYVWYNNSEILCTSYETPSKCRYYLYNIDDGTKRPFCPNSLKSDGHPSLYKEDEILTDTYPDKNGYQYLYFVNSIDDSKKQLFKIYMKPVSNGERRTDLHPRFNVDKSKICIDTNASGKRELVIINID